MKKTARKNSKKTGKQPTKRRRYSPQNQQEDVSIGQLKACFAGWPVSPVKDLGEDLLVQIFDDGYTTGVSFYLQVKSTTDIAALSLKGGLDIAYEFEVKDLLHWELSTVPVVLLVWDISKESGVWLDVPAAIKALDAKSKKWRNQTYATVHLPKKHGTDTDGRDTLRATIGGFYLPLVGKGKDVQMTPQFRFPNTNAGRAKLAALQKVIEEGGSIELAGKELVGFTASDWWEKLMGKRIPVSLTIHPSKSDVRFPLQLVATSQNRTEVASLEMKRTSAGLKQITFDNHHQDSPFRLSFRVPIDDGKVKGHIASSVSISHPVKSVAATLEATKFMIALAEGAEVGMKFNGGTLAMGALNHQTGGRSLEQLLLWEKTLVKVSYIERQVARLRASGAKNSPGQFDLSKGLDNSDLKKIEDLYTIITTGKSRREMSFKFNLKRPPRLPKKHEKGLTEVRGEGGTIKLLGLTILLGDAKATWDDPSVPVAAFEKAAKERSKTVKIASSWVNWTYSDWLPTKKGSKAGTLAGAKRRTSSTKRPGPRRRTA
jgi:hypothetical protein